MADVEAAPERRTERSRSASWIPPESGFVFDIDETSTVDELFSNIPEEVDKVEEQASGSPSRDIAATEDSLDGDRGGISWHAFVLPDTFDDRKHCVNGKIKDCRPVPMIKACDLVNGLSKEGTRWIFKAPLNGWPGLVNLELVSLTVKSTVPGRIKRIWNTGEDKPLPDSSTIKKGTRATLHAPMWSDVGWTAEAPGFVYWWSKHIPDSAPHCLFGETMADFLSSTGPHATARVTKVHALAHRYPVEKETLRDQQTWHSAVVLEWTHAKFVTLVELAWLNGCGGYGGRANWCEDKLADTTALFEAMHSNMKKPWDTKRCEVRAYDLPVTTKDEFHAYLTKYSESGGLPFNQQRFLKPSIYASGACRLRNVTPSALAGYLLNYIHRGRVYHQLSFNCQTFACDLFAFLCGVKGFQPFGAIVKPQYKQRTHSFLYLPDS